MKLNKEKEELIWRNLDNSMSEIEKAKFKNTLENDYDIKNRFNELQQIFSFTRDNIITNPSAAFGDRIMAKIQTIKIAPKRSHWILLSGLLVMVIIGGVYLSEYNSSVSWQLSSLNLPDSDKLLKQIDLNRSLTLDSITKGLFYLLTFLSLVFFDRAILKPYFKGRRISN